MSFRESISSGRSKYRPTFLGTKTDWFIPRPQNHVPNRIGMGAPDANASPLAFRWQLRKGNATVTAAPPSIPRNTERLLSNDDMDCILSIELPDLPGAGQ